MKPTCHIHGLGTHVPERILTNDDLSRIVDTNDEWITTRTGIKQRHILAEDENASDIGIKAAHKALSEAGATPEEVTHVIVATCTPEYICPSTASLIAHKLGCGTVMALDFNAACSGFLYGLSMSNAMLMADPKATILLVCVEALTRRLNWQDRTSCVLFGDGAGALVLRTSDTKSSGEKALASVSNVICHTDGKLWDLITIGGGTAGQYKMGDSISEEFFLQMQGRDVFKHAVRNLVAVAHEVLEQSQLTFEDIDLYIPHQANLRIIEAVGSRLKLPDEKVFSNVHKFGNTSSASVPLALQDAREQGVLTQGKRAMVASVGAGFTWGCGILDFNL